MESTLGVKYDMVCWPYAVSFSNICAKKNAEVPRSTWNRLIHKKNEKKTMENTSPLLAFSKACGWSGHIFAASASPTNT